MAKKLTPEERFEKRLSGLNVLIEKLMNTMEGDLFELECQIDCRVKRLEKDSGRYLRFDERGAAHWVPDNQVSRMVVRDGGGKIVEEIIMFF